MKDINSTNDSDLSMRDWGAKRVLSLSLIASLARKEKDF